jgi:hypothetical protein
MIPMELRVEIEFDVGPEIGPDHIIGRMRTAGGQVVPFSGWIGLLAELQAAYDQGRPPAPSAGHR